MTLSVDKSAAMNHIAAVALPVISHASTPNATYTLTNNRMKRVISLFNLAIQLTGNAAVMYKTAPPTVAAALPTKLEL